MRALHFVPGNDISLLNSGAEFFPALIKAIDEAHNEIYLEVYIFNLDAIGILVRDALQRAAQRGVIVSVITDWLGTGRVASQQLREALLSAGVYHRSFNPWFKRGVARSHRKLCVVDRYQAFIGGLNITNDLLLDRKDRLPLPAPRWDFGVQIRGPLVDEIHEEVQTQWIRLGRMKLETRWEVFKRTRASSRRALRSSTESGLASAALVVRDNLRNRRTIQHAYLQAMGKAKQSIFLASPYFAPGRKMRRALENAATRGVQVTVLLGIGEFRMQDAVARAFYPALLESGVQIFEYTKTQLHAKVAVIDSGWATVGSSNYDGLSLFVNQEANVVILDPSFAINLQGKIEAAIRADSRPVLLSDFVRIPWYKRLGYQAAFLLYRSAIHVITLGRDA